MGIFELFSNRNKKAEYPFDKEKAFHFPRQGVIAGGRFRLTFDPEKIVEYYSYVKPVPENEDGMKDKGADLYFVGLKEGRVTVTLTYEYPTCEPEQDILTLEVDKNLKVTRIL